MSAISISTVQATQVKTTQFTQLTSNAAFEALLGGANGKKDSLFSLQALSSSLLELISGFSTDRVGSAVDFPFTPSFVSTFGTSGPLPTYIAAVSSGLKLSLTQQTALQDIAVRNKDITKTPENVQKIARELQAAGIGYASKAI